MGKASPPSAIAAGATWADDARGTWTEFSEASTHNDEEAKGHGTTLEKL